MKRYFLTGLVAIVALSAFGQRVTKPKYISYPLTTLASQPATPAEIEGCWMYGNFSTTEYWSVNPGNYLGNAFQYAIAFKFNKDGGYEQYFTSSTVSSGIATYHQSFSKGKAIIDPVAKTITTIASFAHYKRTRNKKVEEDRDLSQKEISATTVYSYSTGTEQNGSPLLYLTLQGTKSQLAFMKKF